MNGHPGAGAGAGAWRRPDTAAVASVLALVALWIATRPYPGLVDDARFYAVQVVRSLSGHRFDDDLYFSHGSQDDFSLYTPLVRPVFGLFGIGPAGEILSAGFQALWLGGLLFLVAARVRMEAPPGESSRLRILAAAACCVVVPVQLGFVHPGEAVLTPRLPAEALTLWALGACLRGMTGRALVLLVAAACLHPLMAAPGFAVLFVLRGGRRPVWWATAGVLSLGVLAAAAEGIAPFARLVRVFDPAWLEIVRRRDSFCFVTRWTLADWLPTIGVLGLAGFALSSVRRNGPPLLVASLVVAACGLALSLVAGDVLHDVLILDLQPWRALWLMGIVVHLEVGLLLPALWRRAGSWSPAAPRSLLLAALLAGALSGAMTELVLAAAPLSVLAAAMQLRARLVGGNPGAVARIAALLVAGASVVLGSVAFWIALRRIGSFPSGSWWLLRDLSLTTCGLGCCAVLARRRGADGLGPDAVAFRVVTAAAVLAVLGASSWDERGPWVRFVEAGRVPAALAQVLPATGAIYWDGDVSVPWLLLRRPSAVSCEQGTGVMFNRGTALDYRDRMAVIGRLGGHDLGKGPFCPLPAGGTVETAAGMRAVCSALPGLGAVVLARALRDDPGTPWTAPVAYRDARMRDAMPAVFRTRRFHVYRCAVPAREAGQRALDSPGGGS